MTDQATSETDFELCSAYDPVSRSVSLALTIGSNSLPAHARLALTSVVQLTPAADDATRLVRRLASYHEFAIADEPLAAGFEWGLGGLTPSHRPRHRNDGPVSAFVILPDESTEPVAVVPMRRTGDPAGAARPTGGTESVSSPTTPAIVPFPTSVAIADEIPITTTTAHLLGDHPVARPAWDAISDLEHRTLANRCLHPTEGLPVTPVDDPELDTEAYRLTVDVDQVTVAASTAGGFRHAFVTLARWMAGGLPRQVRVEDQPKYPWRGLHIDVARQWFEPDVVERLIDIAAWRKLSRLHLHLTDDEAWRLPVEGYPELAAIGATRGHGRPLEPMLGGTADVSGRAYTAAEIARWVARADQLGITLVPEVDLPAHNHAALTALPWLRDPDERSGAMSVQFFTDNVLVPGHDLLPDFLDQVVDSVAGLFPSSPWIHIGGDEVPDGAWAGSPIVAGYRAEHGLKTTRDVEGVFHRDLATRVRSRTGRRLGAWQEAAESGGLQPEDGYVVGWRTPEASRQLAAAGYDVVMAPGQAYYLDMAIGDRWDEPGASWAGTVSFDDVCSFVPDAGWTDDERSHILGVQACLWTEHITNEELLRRMLLPRLDAVAERAWTGEIVGGPSSLARRANRLE